VRMSAFGTSRHLAPGSQCPLSGLARLVSALRTPQHGFGADRLAALSNVCFRRENGHAIAMTSTKRAPWYIIPSNHKWFRNLAVSQIIADTMDEMGLKLPPTHVDIAAIRRKFHAAERQEKGRPKGTKGDGKGKAKVREVPAEGSGEG
jgi:hypothetical protein